MLAVVLIPVSASARDLDALFAEPEEFGLNNDNRVGADELADMRGGFSVGGLDFDFAITSTTMIDGIMQHTSTITSAGLTTVTEVQQLAAGLTAENLAQANSAVTTVLDNDALITTIQNDVDNAIIQQINEIDITVSNLKAVQNLNARSQFNVQATQALR